MKIWRTHTYKLFRETKTKVLNVSASLLLVAMSLGSALPAFITSTATAAPNTAYSSVPFTSLGLSQDRTMPANGLTGVSASTLKLDVDSTKNPGSHFAQSEGLASHTFARNSSSVESTLNVPSDWQTKPVDAGLWGVASRSTDASQTGYPILAFVHGVNDPYQPHGTGFSIYNTFTGNWSIPKGFDAVNGWNKSYVLEISYNPANGNFEFYVNGSLLDSYAATNPSDATDTYDGFKQVIFDNFNSVTGDAANNYSVTWSNFSTGDTKPAAPAIHIDHDGTTVASDSVENASFLNGNTVLTFPPIPGADQYVTEITYNGTVVAARWNSSNQTWLEIDGQWPHHDFGNLGDGTYSYRIQARSATSGVWSDWSNTVALTYDTTAPTVNPITANGQPFATDGTAIVSGKNGIQFQFTITDNYAGHDYTYAEVKKADGTWVLGTSGLHLRGSNPSWTIPADKVTDEGTYKLKLCPVDKLGNGTCVIYSFTVDNTSPTFTLTDDGNPRTSISDGSVINPALLGDIDHNGNTIRFTKEAASDTLFVNGTPLFGHGYVGGKSGQIGAAFKTDGTYTVYTKDSAGNQSTPITFTVDSLPPSGTFTYSNHSAPTNGNVYAYLTTTEPVTISPTGTHGWEATDTTGLHFKHKFTNNGTFNAVITDAAGNNTTLTATVNWIDKVAPRVTSYSYSNNGNLTKDDVTVTITTSEAVETPLSWSKVDDMHFTKVFSHNGGFYIDLTDLVGNTATVGGKTQGAEVKRIDKNAPTISGVTDGMTVAGPVHLSVVDPAYEGADGFDANHGLSVNGVEVSTTPGANKTYLYSLSDNGTYTVIATDKAGNNTTVHFTIDNDAPTVTITTPTAGSMLSYTKNGTVDVRGSVSDMHPDHYYLKISGKGFNYSKTIKSSTSFTDQSLYNWNLKGLTSGDYVIDLEAADAAGNKDSGSVQKIHVTIDNDGPSLSYGGYSQSNNVITPQYTDFDGTDTYSWTADSSNPAGVAISDATVLNPDFTVTTTGDYTFTLTATDGLGNATVSSFTFHYTAPDVTTLQFATAGRGVGTNTPTAPRFSDVNGEVLGVTTTGTATDTTSPTTSDGKVKGDKTVNIATSADKHSDNRFLGLGWWWLLVLGALALAWWLFAAYRRLGEQK